MSTSNKALSSRPPSSSFSQRRRDLLASRARAALLAPLWWPLLFFGAWAGFTWLQEPLGEGLAFNAVYLSLLVLIAGLERAFPYRRQWLRRDHEEWNDLGHTLLTKGFVQALVLGASIFGLAEAVGSRPAGASWPDGLPLALQVVIALVASEFALYWAHRLGHTWTPLWRFHAIHHSVTRLWFWNTGRFHLVDTLASLLASVAVAGLLGAPGIVLLHLSAVTAFIGVLTHCNLAVRCTGWNLVFNTPVLHRWHHAHDLRDGLCNYGENLVLWDQIFGTYHLPKSREVGRLGTAEPVPKGFWAQLAWPFRGARSPR